MPREAYSILGANGWSPLSDQSAHPSQQPHAAMKSCRLSPFVGATPHTALIFGTGRKSALGLKKVLPRLMPDWVMLIGVSGALAPGLDNGDIIVPQIFIEGASGRRNKAPALRLAEGDKTTKGAILTSARPIGSTAKKREIYQKSRALAVDMESFYVLEICQGLNIPFFCIRAISDRADQSIPEEITRALRPDGSVRICSVALGTIKRPSLLPELLNLGRGFSVACRRLRQLLPEAIRAIHG